MPYVFGCYIFQIHAPLPAVLSTHRVKPAPELLFHVYVHLAWWSCGWHVLFRCHPVRVIHWPSLNSCSEVMCALVFVLATYLLCLVFGGRPHLLSYCDIKSVLFMLRLDCPLWCTYVLPPTPSHCATLFYTPSSPPPPMPPPPPCLLLFFFSFLFTQCSFFCWWLWLIPSSPTVPPIFQSLCQSPVTAMHLLSCQSCAVTPE